MLALVALAVCVVGCASQRRFEFTQIHMGTPARITLYAADAEQAKAAAGAAFHRIAELDAVMSDYRVSGELISINKAAGGEPTRVGADLFRALELSRDLAARTDGMFDPTVGPVVALWRASRKGGSLPEDAARTRAVALVGWRRLELDPAASTARLATSGMKLDLGGIGKGIACDAAAEVLRREGATSFLISFGGELLAGDPPPGEHGWKVRLPVAIAGDGSELFPLANAALSTSGDSEQHVDIGGVRYSHIVDPRTGLGLTNGATACALATSSALADCVDTALCVAGPGGAGRVFAACRGMGGGRLLGIAVVARRDPEGAGSADGGRTAVFVPLEENPLRTALERAR